MNNQGTIIMAQYPGGYSVSNVLNGNSLANATINALWYKTVPLKKGGTITWRPTDQEDMDIFTPIVTTGARYDAVISEPWIFIGVIGGAPNTTCLQVEYIARYEGQYSNINFVPGDDGVRTELDDSWYTKTKRIVDRIQPIVTTIVDAASVYAGQAALNAVRSGMGGRRRLEL